MKFAYSLTGAQSIKDRAIEKMNEEAHNSVDFYEREFEKAYRELKFKVGKVRADEIANAVINLPW